MLKNCSCYLHNKKLRWACTISDKSRGYCSPLITYNYLRNRGTRCKQRSKLTILYKIKKEQTQEFVQVKDKGANSRFCARYKENNCIWVYVWGVALDYFITTPFWIKWTHDISLITTFLIIITRATALVNIRRKMVIHEKLFVNFIKNSVMHYWWKFRLLMRFYSSVSLFSDGIPSPDGTLACMF